MQPAAQKVKPRLRGVSHVFAFVASLGGFLFLALSPAERSQYLAGLVYGASLLLTFGLSALYHRPMWGMKARFMLRRLDHAAIAALIAGTYTPVALLDGKGEPHLGLWVMWIGAGLTVLRAVFWSHAPRFFRTGGYVALGFVALPVVLRLPALIGPGRVWLLLVGAAIYLLGAAVYALRWPNPRPAVFGYHEVFHALVIAAAAVHYAVLLDVQYNVAA